MLGLSDLLDRLPKVRGRYRENVELARTTWFRVGGPAEVLFRPADADDLAPLTGVVVDVVRRPVERVESQLQHHVDQLNALR